VLAASEKPVKMADLPLVVRQAVEKETKGATLLLGLSKETEGGKVFYEAETIVNGHHRDILFTDSGIIAEVEEETTLDSIPPAARSAIEKYAGQSKVLKVETVTRDNTTNYEAEVRKGLRKSEVAVSPDGKIVK
jgi:hypothetical protein